MERIKKGQIWYADLSGAKGSEQGGVRPVLVIQNKKGNEHSPTVSIAPITSKKTKAKLPTHIWLSVTCGLTVNSMVMVEQTRTLDRIRFLQYVGEIQQGELNLVNEAIRIQFEV